MLQKLFQKWLPQPPPYDPVHAQHLPLRSRRRLGAQAWALQGYGAPWILILFHIVKMLVYLGVWVGFVWLHSDPGLSHSEAFFSIEAFQRFILWSLLFEVLGFGCGSGPLTGRYAMPFGAFWHFFRPGTIRMRPFSRLWKKANATRGLLDVAVFTCHVLCLLALLFSPNLEAIYFLPSILLFVIMSLRDQVFFLASRGEHYGVILICFAFGEEGIAGAMIVQSSIWLWAALS
ncbi:MAG: DUF3556 domain-containing protein, partial [Myxococcota bacterium]|nr:DUF3556 domain-containing protein [Myxococcota bacterium]